MGDHCPLCLEEDGLRCFSSPMCECRIDYHLTCYLKSNERYGCLVCRQQWRRRRYYHLFIFALLIGCLRHIQPLEYYAYCSWLVVASIAMISLGTQMLSKYRRPAIYNRVGELFLLLIVSSIFYPSTLIWLGLGGCVADVLIDVLIYIV